MIMHASENRIVHYLATIVGNDDRAELRHVFATSPDHAIDELIRLGAYNSERDRIFRLVEYPTVKK